MAKKGKTKANVKKTTAQARPKARSPKAAEAPAAKTTRNHDAPVQLPFGRMNYILLLIGIGIIALGFILMSQDPFVDAREFSISLYVAPPIVVLGFLEVIFAIMYKPKEVDQPEKEEVA
jgi:hypothetical protein